MCFAQYRTELCDALPWFRAVQGGAYSDRGLCFGCLLDADSGLRPYVDDEIIITRMYVSVAGFVLNDHL